VHICFSTLKPAEYAFENFLAYTVNVCTEYAENADEYFDVYKFLCGILLNILWKILIYLCICQHTLNHAKYVVEYFHVCV
jgi:hypothetical protein